MYKIALTQTDRWRRAWGRGWLRYVFTYLGIITLAELVPSHGASRRRLGDNSEWKIMALRSNLKTILFWYFILNLLCFPLAYRAQGGGSGEGGSSLLPVRPWCFPFNLIYLINIIKFCLWKHHVHLLLQSFRPVSPDLHQC
jgi:hypothetical protein